MNILQYYSLSLRPVFRRSATIDFLENPGNVIIVIESHLHGQINYLTAGSEEPFS